MQSGLANELTGKYVISPIDGKKYCRGNGQFLRHLRENSFNTYQDFFNTWYPDKIKKCSCGNTCSFENKTMSYLESCSNRKCVGNTISKTKQKFSPKQWEAQKRNYHATMSLKSQDDIKNIVERRKQTYFRRHGVEHRLQNNVPADSLEKLKSKQWLETQHLKHKKTAVQIAEDLNVGVTTATNWLHRHDIPIQLHRQSQIERELVDFIKQQVPECVIETSNRNIISPLELDIFLPNEKLAIEINGVFWHGETKGKQKNYHIDKTKMCLQKNIKLIHVWDEEWINKTNIVKSRILNVLGRSNRIYARQCKIVHIPFVDAAAFLNQTHTQGSTTASICYGLTYNKNLVAVMSFSPSRFSNKYQYEMIRYSNALNYSVVGGASKIFQHFITEHQPENVVSYSDKRWGNGDMYLKLGFQYTHTTPPNYKYFKTTKPLELFSRQQFQKHKLPRKLLMFNSSLTEWENMINNGYDRVWDCGSDVFVWRTEK